MTSSAAELRTGHRAVLFIDVENVDAWDSDAVPGLMELQMYFPAILRGTNICR